MITSEALAISWHNHTEIRASSEAASMGVQIMPQTWDDVPENQRKKMIAVAEQVIEDLLFYPAKPGESGPEDQGAMAILVSSNQEKQMVRMDFTKELKWFAMPAKEAIPFALLILQHCGVPVNVTMAPVAGPPPGPAQDPH